MTTVNVCTDYAFSLISQALDRALASEGYTCLERNIPMLVYGNKTDLEVSISADSYPQGSTTLHSQVSENVFINKVLNDCYCVMPNILGYN